MLKGREGQHCAPVLPVDPVSEGFGQVWRCALRRRSRGRGLDGIVVGLDGDMVVKVNRLHPDALKTVRQRSRRSTEAKSEERFKKEANC